MENPLNGVQPNKSDLVLWILKGLILVEETYRQHGQRIREVEV